jgi:hypothetical protein
LLILPNDSPTRRTDFFLSRAFAISTLLLLASCGGGGGGGDSSAPANNIAPQAALTAQSLPLLPANNASILNCPTVSNFSVSAPPAMTAGTISGRVTFDRVPFSQSLGLGLDYANQSVLPARGIVVEAIAPGDTGRCSGTVLATALTDGDGWYELRPNAGNTAVCVRARAQLYRASDTISAVRWNIGVADNTDGATLYQLNETSAASATARARRDLYATSGWSNGAYTGARAAAPFAILDTACKAMNAVVAIKPAAQFGALTYFWSTKNTSDSNGTLTDGKVGGAFFSSTDAAIYLRGDAAVDTDEFDEMVVAHEFGHFVTYTFSRSDSIGGEHSLLDYVDPRVAFDEGWATAFAGLVLHTSIYRDSNQLQSSASSFAHEFFFNIQGHYGSSVPTGWYSEMSMQRALFNIGADASFNGLGIGIEGLLQTFSGAYKTSPALATIFSYGSQLKSDQAATANDIAQVLNDEAINGDSVQPFAETETNAANSNDLPVYQNISTSGAQTVCSNDDYGSINMLSNRRYLRFDVNTAGNYNFSVQPQNGYPQAVAGFELLNRGRNMTHVVGTEGDLAARSTHYSTIAPLATGTYVLSVFHVGNAVKDSTIAPGPQCFNVTVAAAP